MPQLDISKIKLLATNITCCVGGITSIEYALIAVVVSITILSAVTTMGIKMNNIFSVIANTF